MEETAHEFEKSTLELRRLCERYSPGVGGYGSRPQTAAVEAAGYVDMLCGSWLHICINTLLPHCRFQSPGWLSDTIRRLLDGYERGGGVLPYFRGRALLIIDERSDVQGRHIFDQDNKGWKAVCNAIKGRLVPDDDQYTLGVVLISEKSSENICHITLIDHTDASDFFAVHSGSHAARDFYGGAWY